MMAAENNNVIRREQIPQLIADASRGTNMALDLRLSLFIAALHSYRRNSLLKPFPPNFVQDEEKQFDKLQLVVDRLPRLSEFKTSIKLSEEEWQLISWVQASGNLQLRLLSQENVSLMLQSISGDCRPKHAKFLPSYVFEITSPAKRKFQEAKDRYGSFKAFHGSKVENFHSILHQGLVNSLNKRDAFGSGTYLSSELSVAIEFSPFSAGWANSEIGQRLSIIALCEVASDPSVIKTKSASKANDIPQSYFIVRNDDLIKVTHLLVYKADVSGQKFSTLAVISMVVVVIALLAAGALNSVAFRRFLRRLMQ